MRNSKPLTTAATTTGPDQRMCQLCQTVDISHRSRKALRCEPCAKLALRTSYATYYLKRKEAALTEARKAQMQRYNLRRQQERASAASEVRAMIGPRICANEGCQTDISARHINARFCQPCQVDRARASVYANRRQGARLSEYLKKYRRSQMEDPNQPEFHRCHRCGANTDDNPGLKFIDYFGRGGKITWNCWNCYDEVCREIAS